MNKRNIIFLVSLSAVLIINLYLRAFPIFFPQLKTQARQIVGEGIRQATIRDIQQRFPQYYPSAKDSLLKSRVKQYKRQNKKALNEQIQGLYLQLKDNYQDDTGQTYIMELDCWHWGRYVENVVNRGRPGDQTIFGREWDQYMLAPNGYFLQWQQFLYYFSAYLYKFFTLFRPVELYTFLFYLPLFFTAIFIVGLYIFSYKYSGHFGAIISCLFVGFAPTFLYRSCAGWFDKDILNLVFPLLAVWTYIKSYENQPLRRRLFWIIFSSFWVGLFCFNWTHWWFVFFIVFIYESVYLASLLFTHFYLRKNKIKPIKQHSISVISFSAFSFFWILLISGNEPIRVLYTETIKAVFLTKPLVASVWPNVLYTVGELRKADIRVISESLGGVWLSAFTFICMILILARAIWYKPYSEPKRAAIIIFGVWFIAMLFASFGGIRFVIFLIVPLGICAGWLIDEIYRFLRRDKNIKGLFFLLIALLVIGSLYFRISYLSAANIYPLINDKWYKVLNIIKEKTPQNSVLNSWWDYGDWFKVIARRRVIFDGQSQVFPQAYWMAKTILTDNEDQAIAILRMLNNGGNRTFEIMNKYIEDPLEAVLLLESTMMLDPKDAKEILTKFLPASATNKVMQLLFSAPSTAHFIVEDTMVPKIGAISYLGNWDFSKVYIAQKLGGKEEHKIIERLVELGKDKELMQKFYQEAFLINPKSLDDWLSNRLQFYSPLANGAKKDDAVFFENGYMYKPKEKTIHSKDGYIPRSLFIFEDNDVKEIVYENPNVIYSVLVSEGDEEGNYKCVLLDRELGKSLFSRLYFLNGKGLKHFMLFIDVEEGNQFIQIYDIKW
ncbi:MAG: STT3 domain-containing protein [Patescibacteria group bacterium]